MSHNPFAIVAKNKAKFASSKGQIDLYQVYDAPLLAKKGETFSLEELAQNCDRDIKELDAPVSFVAQKKPARGISVAKAKLEVIVHIIREKEEAASRALQASAKAEERKQLLAALAVDEADELKNMSKEDKLARLKALED